MTKRLRITALAVLVVVAIASSLWGALPHGDWKGLALNFGTEMAGAVATYALLEVFLGSRERRETKKADLIAQLGSGVKDVAVAAAEELYRHGWLEDGSLCGVNLFEANLSGADLGGADLSGVKFSESTILPDETNWTPDTDMARFTDPEHPDFWHPDAEQ